MASSNAGRRAREQRASIRFDSSMPVRMAHGNGTTRDISARGVYFETDVRPPQGALVNFSVEYTLMGRTHRLLCEAKVVRVEPQGTGYGVAARLLGPFFEGEEEVRPAPSR